MKDDEHLTKALRFAMARAFFWSAYADAADEAAHGMAGSRDWMDALPHRIDRAALHAADTLMMDMVRANHGVSILSVYKHAREVQASSPIRDVGDRPCTPEMFGHYCAMQAMGHGVGLGDAFGKNVYEAVQVPHVEFGSHSLEKDYF